MNERLAEMRVDALGMVKVSKGPEKLAWELLASVCELLLKGV